MWFQGRERQRRYLYLPPLLLFDRENEATGERTTLFPLGYRIVDRRSRSFGIIPLVLTHASGPDHYTFVPPLFTFHWGNGIAERTVVLSGYYARDAAGYDLGLAPLFFHGRRADGSHYTHLAPLVWHWGDRNAQSTIVVPFYYAFRSDDRYRRAVTPLFHQWGDRQARKSLLFPIAYLAREGASSLFLSPLVVAHFDAVEQKQRVVVFPFYWRFAGRDSAANVGFPVWWDFHDRRRGSRLSILFPFGFRYDRRDETTTMLLNVVYTRGKGRFADAWSFHFFPLFDVASFNADHFKWQVLMGIVGRERQGRQARWRIVYVWTDPG